MSKLWIATGKKCDSLVEEFCSGADSELDLELVEMDCAVNEAHAKQLVKTGILSGTELKKIQLVLKEIVKLHKKREFKISKEQEDVHTAIENFLVEKLGSSGKKIHAGKSRNDQCAADLLLYSKKKLKEVSEETKKLKKEIEKFSEKNSEVKMPGYTHSRKAMPSTIGLWASSFVSALGDDISLMKSVAEWIDKCPMGSAAGYGTSIALNKQEISKELGFSSEQENSLYAVGLARGKYESAALFSLAELMLSLNKLASDIILFSGSHFGFLELIESICTGSSIMPHKKNPDVFELVRAKNSELQSLLFQSLVGQNSIPSGYNRDLQIGKKSLVSGFKIVLGCTEILSHVFPKIEVNEEKCAGAISDEMFSAKKTVELAKKGVPFREAYKQLKAD